VPLTESQSQQVLRLRGISKAFAGVPALQQLDLEVGPREILSLIGPSGCGKTTTLRVIAGLEVPDGGSVEIAGRDCRLLPPERRSVGFVFQDYALFPHLTVAENVSFGLDGLHRSERKKRVAEVLDLVGLPEMSLRLPRELSGGQQQRVALARAIAPKPALLLLDEPFSNLDPQLRRQVRHEVLAIVRASGSAAVWVTHDHDEGLIVADRVVVMKDGRACQAGTPSEIWRSPQDAWVAGFIGHGDLLKGTVSNGRLVTSLGDVAASGIPEGAEATVLVRPEDVVIVEHGSPGTVVRRHFSGSDNIYCVQIDGTLLHCRQPSDVEIPRGTEIRVKLKSDSLPVFS